MNVRKVELNDLPLVQQWAEAHGISLVPELLSPYGFLAEDEHGPVGVLWAYLLCDVPVAMIDNQFTRPGLRGRQALRCWESLWSSVKTWLGMLKRPDGEPLNYRIVRAFCVPGMVPQAERSGWHVSPGTYHQTFHLL